MEMKQKKLSIIIPTLNEAGNIRELVERVNAAMESKNIIYEIIFVDDNSTDNTSDIVKQLRFQYPLYFFKKKGKRGKAYSLLEGFSYADYDTVAILDADLQYPPEALLDMILKIEKGFDIVVAKRVRQSVSVSRKILNLGFSLFFSKILHNFDCDVQSGMKMFRRKIIEEIKLDPSPWTFDLEFLIRARFYGYKIGNAEVFFVQRRCGKSKIVFHKAIYEIGANAIRMRFKKLKPLLIAPEENSSMIGAGVAYNKKRFITHTTLENAISAVYTFIPWQRNLIIFIIGIFLIGIFLNPFSTGIAAVSVLSSAYLIDMFFNFYLVHKSLHNSLEIKSSLKEIKALNDAELPAYSILCPLYKEAHMLPVFAQSISKIDWPKDRLDVLLLLEEDDEESIAKAEDMKLPDYFRILKVPFSMPKTKPKACNYGLSFAKGEYIVIYDAEDIPDPLQLKKAYLGFQKASAPVRCLQAKLNYFNPGQNLLTRLFMIEYSLWFDVILPGLQAINTAIPLGGTSNHFRRRDLLELKGWDPFNVTEDCDLGMRIFNKGGKTAIIDSVTLEEANSNLKNWLRQRSRWIKGYIQTYLVHMRNPISFFRKNGIHAFIFQFVVGAKIIFIFINPVLWMITFSYFALYVFVGPAIEKLYPPLIFYIGTVSLVFGNFLYFYYYIIGCAKREQWPYVKYVFLVPFYWFLMSAAALIAGYQLFIKPHYWEKTNHGLHLLKASRKQPAKKKYVEEIPDNELRYPQEKKGYAWAWKELALKKVRSFDFQGKGFFIAAILFSNFLNLIFNIFLGRTLSFENLALVNLVSALWYIALIFSNTFSSAINHRIAYLSTKFGIGSSKTILDSIVKKGIPAVSFLALIWILAVPFLSDFFQISNHTILIFFTLAFIFGFFTSANSGFLQGNLFFSSAAVIFLAESVSKLVFAGIFIFLNMAELVYSSILIAIIIASLVSMLMVKRKTSRVALKANSQINPSFSKKFFISALMINISVMAFLSLDIILVKHFLPPALAGEYVILSLVGKMIYFFGSLPAVFMISLVSRNDGLRLDTKKIFAQIYAAAFILSVFGVLILGFFGNITVPLLFGDKAAGIIPFLGIYSSAIFLLTISNVVVVYNLAKKKYLFAVISLAMAFGMALGISFFHSSIQSIVTVIFFVSGAGWAVISILHNFESRVEFLKRNFVDFLDVFWGKLPQSQSLKIGGKSILIFNWRDTRHKFAGGAEIYTQLIAEEWVKDGNRVTVFCGNDSLSPRSEIIGNVEIIRRGGFYFVYIWAFLYYIFRFRGKYDVIIDCQNGIPFFTPLYSGKPVYCLMHHVHQEVFRKSLNKSLAILARFLEKSAMPLVYKNIVFITVSSSSREKIKELGLGKAGIHIVNPGVNLEKLRIGDKSEKPLALYLGRLKAYKSIEILIKAFKLVLRESPEASLVIAGDGEEEENLKSLANKLDIDSNKIKFAGKVSEKEKISLLQKAWVLVNPSMMEGWGIVVIEANACGTPVVASNVPGLCDSIKDPSTGYLVEYGDEKEFAEYILKIIQDKNLRNNMGIEARVWAENFDWKNSSDKFMSIMKRDDFAFNDQKKLIPRYRLSRLNEKVDVTSFLP